MGGVGRADPTIGDEQHTARAFSRGDGLEVLEDAIDIRAEGVWHFALEVARLDLAHDGGKHKEAEKALFMREAECGGEFWQVRTHRAADVQVDMRDGEWLESAAFFDLDSAIDQRPGAVQRSPSWNAAVAWLRDHGFDRTRYGGSRQPARGVGRSSANAGLAEEVFENATEVFLWILRGVEFPRVSRRALIAAAENAVRARPFGNDVANGFSKKRVFGAVGAFIGMVAEQHALAAGVFLQRFDEKLEDLEVGGSDLGGTVEEFDDTYFLGAGVLRQLETTRPEARWAQEPSGEAGGVVDRGEERPIALLGKLMAEHGVDHRVEGEVVGLGGSWKQTRVAEHHMVEFVQDEHEEVLVGAAVFLDEAGIETQARARGAVHAGGRDRIIENDVEQREKFLHLPSGGGDHIVNTGSDVVGSHRAPSHTSAVNGFWLRRWPAE